MASADFSPKTVVERFDPTLPPREDLFVNAREAEIPSVLRNVPERWAPRALEVHTQKARSKLIIAPISMEAMDLAGPDPGVYAGVSLDVDRERGLFGRCDVLIGRRTGPFLHGSPLRAVVEAKDEDIPGNPGRCVAEMVAVRILNEREGHPIRVVHGAVTAGAAWLFLQLEGDAVTFDLRERFLDDAGRILGDLASIGSAAEGRSCDADGPSSGMRPARSGRPRPRSEPARANRGPPRDRGRPFAAHKWVLEFGPWWRDRPVCLGM